ncbi:unnamed protein product [Lactuca virosa]|uniref:Uncharacterized protein n=1 Tax=Lactuca virosa TaxID=75947 RepID=A0AAU9NLX9_9ASTR|nr:unnamed protein product [Lactuca virosa]
MFSTRIVVYMVDHSMHFEARDRLEQLNTSSPNYASRWNYLGVYSVLLVVFTLDAIWIMMCLVIYQIIPSSMFLLLFFEPLSIAFETLQGILVHGFQLVDIWAHHSRRNTTNSKLLTLIDTSAAASKTLFFVILLFLLPSFAYSRHDFYGQVHNWNGDGSVLYFSVVKYDGSKLT